MISDFLRIELLDCHERGLEAVLHPTATVKTNGIECAGWFDDKIGLHVAIGRPLEEWLPVFVHESCHKDQFVQHAVEWDTKIDGVDATDVLDVWLHSAVLDGATDLDDRVVDRLQRVELDCERRSVHKITKHGLPIDLGLYVKKANAYVWFYRALPILRRWIVAPYNNPRLLALMPAHFVDDYRILPEGFMDVLEEMS